MAFAASDYPHPESRFPESATKVLACKSLGDEVMRKMLWDNATRSSESPSRFAPPEVAANAFAVTRSGFEFQVPFQSLSEAWLTLDRKIQGQGEPRYSKFNGHLSSTTARP
jgi:hypothetical protein